MRGCPPKDRLAWGRPSAEGLREGRADRLQHVTRMMHAQPMQVQKHMSLCTDVSVFVVAFPGVSCHIQNPCMVSFSH